MTKYHRHVLKCHTALCVTNVFYDQYYTHHYSTSVGVFVDRSNSSKTSHTPDVSFEAIESLGISCFETFESPNAFPQFTDSIQHNKAPVTVLVHCAVQCLGGSLPG